MADFETFKAAFTGDIVTPSDSDYEQAISRWAKNASRRAKVVAFIKDANDAALALKYATSANLPLAIRGGGHSASGCSSSEGGLVIDLSRYLDEARIDVDEKLAYVKGGAVWKTVDEAAIEHGLATVGGTVNHTGVGGLTLGGGYGWLTGEYGLAIDNVVQVTLVTADGSILTVNENENSELFWAIRGGGSNFGVVTEFVYKLHEQRKTVYAGMLIYPEPLFDDLMRVTGEWWTAGPSPKESMLQVTTRGPPPDCHPCVISIVFYNGSEEEGRQIFKKFIDLGPIDNTAEIPYEQLNTLQNAALDYGHCVYLRGCTQAEMNTDMSRDLFNRVMKYSTGEFRVIIGHEFFPLGAINKVSNDATAFNNRREHCNISGGCIYDNDTPENQKYAKSVMIELTELVASGEKKPEDSKFKAYGNYENEGLSTSDGAAKLFGDNYSRLRLLKKKYDPEMLFAKWFPIQPAI